MLVKRMFPLWMSLLLMLMPLLLLFCFLGCTGSNQTEKQGEGTEHSIVIPDDGNGTDNPDPAHTSRNALDWAGVYRGVIPCADCEGIDTEIVLNDDMTYEKRSKYLGKSDHEFVSKGSFSWDEAGLVITLEGVDGRLQSNRYHVGENKLFKLDMQGNRMTGALEERYILKKEL